MSISNALDIESIQREAKDVARRIMALGIPEGKLEDTIDGTWEAGYVFGSIDSEPEDPKPNDFENSEIDTIGKCANCGVEFHIHKLKPQPNEVKGGVTKEQLEDLYEECHDRHTAATEGGYGADYTDKWAVWKDLLPHIEKYASQSPIPVQK